MKTIKPPRLLPGQNLGVFALSVPGHSLKPEFRKRAYERIKESFDLNVIEAPNLDTQVGHTAGNIKDRVKSLHDFFKRKDIHGIMSFWGGMNTHHVLEYLDYDLFKRHPKVLIGYSDTTTLLSAITQKSGLITFNGPAIITFAKPSVPMETVDCFKSLLMNSEASYSYASSKHFSDNQWWVEDKMEFVPNPGPQTWKTGIAEGRIVGGNAGALLLLAGTSYWPSMKDKILFIEDDEAENPKTIDRFFTQLRQMGVFDKINGLVIGRFPRCVGFTECDSLKMILQNALKGYRFPVLTEFDMGHTDPILTIPLGAKVRLDAARKKITLLEAPVK